MISTPLRGLPGRRPVLPLEPVLFEPLEHFTVLLRDGLDYKVVAPLQRIVRVVRTVAVRVRKPHLAVGGGTDERPLSCVQSLVRLQLAGLGEGARTTRVVTLVGTFAWRKKEFR